MNSQKMNWPTESRNHALKLHSLIKINNEDWHKLRSNHKRRAAELLSAAIIQLINNGETTDITEKTEQALRWLKKEINDPGCGEH